MKDAQRPDHVSLITLVNRLREGRFVIPDFQREFEWKPWDISELMRSIFLDYYIGSLLLWKGKKENFDALACEPIYGFQGQRGARAHRARWAAAAHGHVLRIHGTGCAGSEPRQPLPLLHSRRSLHGGGLRRGVRVRLDTTRREDPRQPTSRSTRSTCFRSPSSAKGLGAVRTGCRATRSTGSDKAAARQVRATMQAPRSRAGTQRTRRQFDEHLEGITEQYQISYIELDRELELDKVCDIFTQINSRGIRLDVFDLINALLKPRACSSSNVARSGSAAGLRRDRADERLHPPGDVHPSPGLLLAQVPLLPAARPGERRCASRTARSARKCWFPTSPSSRRAGTKRSRRSSGDQAAAPPAGVRRHLVAVPALCVDPAGFRGASGRRPRRCPPAASSTHSERSATGTGPACSPTATPDRSNPRAPRDYWTSRPGSRTTRPSLRSSPSFAARFRDTRPAQRDQARHLGLQRHLQPACASRRARLDDRQRPAIRRPRRPPHRPEELGQGARQLGQH